MKLERISVLTGELELVTGLHIGSGDAGMKIGGIDSPVVKHPISDEPYIPGSSIKGKVRSLLEWHIGVVHLDNGAPLSWASTRKAEDPAAARRLVQLFGSSADAKLDEEQALELGPTRLSFWDCPLDAAWLKQIKSDNLPLTEEKSENRIDRIKAVAESPRFIERVPAGARFDFRLTLKQLTGDGDDPLELLMRGLKLLELDGLGGSSSRGYGKIRFNTLTMDDQDLGARLAALDLNA